MTKLFGLLGITIVSALCSPSARAEDVRVEEHVERMGRGTLSLPLHHVFPSRFRSAEWTLVALEAEVAPEDSHETILRLVQDRIHSVSTPVSAFRNELADLGPFFPVRGDRLHRVDLRVDAEGSFTVRRLIGTFRR